MSLLRLVHQFVTMVQLLTTSHNKPESPLFQTSNIKSVPLYLSDDYSNGQKLFNKYSEDSNVKSKRTKFSYMFHSHPVLDYEGLLSHLDDAHSGSYPKVHKAINKENLNKKKTKMQLKKMKNILISPKKSEKFQSTKCWDNIYHLLNLYSNMIDTNKPFHRSASIISSIIFMRLSLLGGNLSTI